MMEKLKIEDVIKYVCINGKKYSIDEILRQHSKKDTNSKSTAIGEI